MDFYPKQFKGNRMFRKIIASFLILATTTVFGMSLSALNGASKAELMEINGIGEVKAAAIMKERRKGKFKSFQDLERVEGIGVQTAANVKNGVKSSADVKKVSKKTKTKAKKKTAKKSSTKTKAKSTKKTKEKATKTKKPKKRKIKSMDDKKKELKTKAKKTKTKKTKAKKTKKTKAKKTKKTKSKKKKN
jgi:competence protein ComEA